MAMIKCKECQKDISDTADACPNCGAKVPKPSGCFKVILFSLGIIVLMVIFSSKSGTPQSKPFDAEGTARGLCMFEIKARLHDPDSAEFEHFSQTTIITKGDTWYVTRPVRAKNAFNATRRAIYLCTLKRMGNDFITQSVVQLP